MEKAMDNESHWNHYQKSWQRVCAPLRPSSEDLKAFSSLVPKLPKQPKILVLGVTPELVAIDWPIDATLYGVDKSEPFIHGIWKANPKCQSMAICANWFSIPFAEDSFDLIIGDGISPQLRYPDEYRQIAVVAHKLLKPGGFLALRNFLRPNEKQEENDLWASAHRNEYKNFSAFKWRLAHTLQDDPAKGIAIDTIYQSWQTHRAYWDNRKLPLPWPEADIATVEVYQGSTMRYVFLSEEETQAVYAEHFIFQHSNYGTYELASCCPVMIYENKP